MKNLSYFTLCISLSVTAVCMGSHSMEGSYESNKEVVACPTLSKELILKNNEAFPHPFRNEGGTIEIDGRAWKVHNAQSYDADQSGSKQSFVYSATQPDILQRSELKKYTNKGANVTLCRLQFHLPNGSDQANASVDLVHREPRTLMQQTMKKVQKFTHIDKTIPEPDLNRLPTDLKNQMVK